jgi:hypothetical protein
MAKSEFSFQDFMQKFSTQLKQEYAKRKRKTSPDPTSRGFETELGNDDTDAETMPRSSTSNNLIKFLRFCLFFAAGALIVLNIKPYINISAWIGTGLGDIPFIQSLSQYPALAWLFSNSGMGIAFITGFLLWGLLQGLEMLPEIILNDPDALLVLMSWVYQFKKIRHKDSDSALLRKLKYRFNNLPLEWIEGMQQARAIAYIVDAILCFGYYPPIVGGYDRLGVFLIAPNIRDLNAYNIVAAIATMFGLEVLYKVYKMVKTALDVMAETQAHREA